MLSHPCKRSVERSGLISLAVCIFIIITGFTADTLTKPVMDRERVLVLDSGSSSYDLKNWADVFEDKGALLGIDKVSSLEFRNRFLPLSSLPRTIGHISSHFWIRVSLAAGESQTAGANIGRWILYNWAPFVGMLEVYTPVPDSGGDPRSWQRAVTGRNYLWETQRQLFGPTALPLDLPKEGPVTLYLCVSSSSAMGIRLSVDSPTSFQNRSARLLMSHSAFLGLLSGFMIYSLFMWLIARESIYLYATIYMFFGLLAAFNYRGPQVPILSSYPPLVSDYMRRFSWVLASIVMVLITRKFFRARELSPKIDNALLFLIPLMLAPWVVVVVTGRIFPYFHLLRNATTNVAHVFVFSVACLSWLKGFKPARYFLAGFLINSMAVVFSSFQLFGWIPYTPENSVEIPNLLYAAAVIFFFLALADKINELRNEKNELIRSERRFKELSHTDGLTGLFNKRYLNSKLKGDVEHALRLSSDLSLVVIDIDHFKSFNDRFGHLEGDRILKLLGSVMLEMIRDDDSACRYGGEEFVVITPETDQEGALLLAERIRRRFKEKTSGLDPAGRYACTLSAGIAGIREGDTEQLIFKRADEALYLAKSSGRDRVLISS